MDAPEPSADRADYRGAHRVDRPTHASMTLVQLNREMERKWRAGEITFNQFDWHLRTMCGI